jgi:hypothetical protein
MHRKKNAVEPLGRAPFRPLVVGLGRVGSLSSVRPWLDLAARATEICRSDTLCWRYANVVTRGQSHRTGFLTAVQRRRIFIVILRNQLSAS